MLLSLAQQAAAEMAAADGTYFIWGCALLGIALVLVVVELFVPSGGVIGLLAGTAAIGSVVAFFRYDNAWGWGALGSYVFLGPVVLYFIFKLWLHSPVAKNMILGGAQHQEPEEAFASSEQQRAGRLARLHQLVGSTGVTATSLRPVGTIIINGERLDGMAESGIIEAGQEIVVTDVYDNQVKVRSK